MPVALVNRLVSALERLAAGQSVDAAIDFRNTLATETNAAIARWQTEALGTIADRLSRQPAESSRPGGELSLPQRELVLSYDAFRTALGRTGAASIVVGFLNGTVITITSERPLPGGRLTLVAFSKGREIGQGDLSAGGEGGQRQATVEDIGHLPADQPVDRRFSIRDETGSPILLGLLETSSPNLFGPLQSRGE
jgi:hypothetical protein